METKICSNCKEEKLKTDFIKNKYTKDFLGYHCSCCRRLSRAKWSEKKKAYDKQYRIDNREKRRLYNIDYVNKNKEEWHKKVVAYREANRADFNRRARESFQRNKNERQKSHRLKLDTDPVYRLKRKFYYFIKDSFKRSCFPRQGKNRETIGCEYDFFIQYIEAQFVKGMNWDNIHIDHIKPLSTAKTPEDVVILCHYTNLQPLFIKDNILKSDNLIEKQLRLI